MFKNKRCVFCNNGILIRDQRDVEYTNQYGQKIAVLESGWYCDHCHESIMLEDDLKRHRETLALFRNKKSSE